METNEILEEVTVDVTEEIVESSGIGNGLKVTLTVLAIGGIAFGVKKVVEHFKKKNEDEYSEDADEETVDEDEETMDSEE